jgi:uncharacterized membrane protein
MARTVARSDARTYSRVGYTLLGGLWLSVAVMVAGLLLSALGSSGSATHVTPLADVLSALASGKPAAILSLGILLLFATPLAGVLVALAEFLETRDLPFVWVTVALVVILVIGFAVALR